MSNLKTALYEQHVGLKAKMAPFAGYDMPIQYTSVKEEVLAVRNACGVFDVSHMGEFFAVGPDAVRFVDHLITNEFASVPNEKAVYSPLCRENGTVIDDLIAYKLGPEKVLICVNAANIQKDWDWISKQTAGFDITLENKSDKYSLLAVQGPGADKVLKTCGVIPERDIKYYSAFEHNYQDKPIILARSGYTGEKGFEVFGGHATILELWQNLLKNGATPCGLASRDVLRLEVCFPLYGHELNDEITPLDAGLKWTVKLEKPNFIGKSALENYEPRFRLAKLILPKGIARDGYEVLNGEGQIIGTVTSGTMSVVLGKGVCLALIEKSKFPSDKKFLINIRNKHYEAEHTEKAFVTGGHK